MKDDQRKGEGLRSDGDGDDGGLSVLLGLVFFSMVVMVMVIISLSSVWGFGINPQVSWDMMMMAVVVKGEEDQTIEEGLDLWWCCSKIDGLHSPLVEEQRIGPMTQQ